jgi:GT2 family glycosyltransferase
MKRLISVIICTCNRPDLLKKALISIAQQKTDGSFNFEVIVVDNSPTGTMESAVREVSDHFQGRQRYTREPKRGKSFALNHGIKEAKGDILAFTDDDITAEPLWLIKLNKAFNQYNCDGIGGKVLPVYPEETPQWVKDNAVQLAGGVVIYDHGENDFPYSDKIYPFIGANYAFKRELFEECGDFRTDLGPGAPAMGEDTEITERLAARGKKLYYCGSVLMWHPVDLSRLQLKHLAKWHIALGRYAAKMEIENKVKISSYFLGIPRYLFRGVIVDAGSILITGFDRMRFLNAWRSFFRQIGMIREYRRLSLPRKF